MIELKNVGFFKSSIEAISPFIPEGNFRFNEKGIHFRSIDPSQILLVDYFVDKSAFDKFSIEPAFVGLNISELEKVFNRAMPNDVAIISLSESEIVITFKNELERSFRIPLIDVSDEEQKLPQENYDSFIEISARLLKEALKDASVFGSGVVFRVKGEKFFLESKGDSGSMNLSSLHSKFIKVKSKAESVSKYSLSYLQNIVRSSDADSVISIAFKSEAPMKISYKIGPSNITFYLAHMLL
ncbi:MAG: hypothetical protein QXD98_01110 [Candidatus Diapherotrites archaeon]